MAHSLIQLHVHGVIEGVAAPKKISDSPQGLVDFGGGACGSVAWRARSAGDGRTTRKEVSGRCESGERHVAVVSANQHVYSVRAHIAQIQREVLSNLTLHVEIPLQHVIPVRVRFHYRGAQFAWLKSRRRVGQKILPSAGELSLQRVTTRCGFVHAVEYHEWR